MFRALVCPSSGICDYVVELPHWPFRSAERNGQWQTPEDGHINDRNMLSL